MPENTEFQSTPSANRIHIGFFGRRNSGKSSLINAFTGQQTAIVSDVAGTTTDPVSKPMEIKGIGPCVLIDTAGFDDEGELGLQRVEKTKAASAKTELAVILIAADREKQSGAFDLSLEKEWADYLSAHRTKVITVISKCDTADASRLQELHNAVSSVFGNDVLHLSTADAQSIKALKEAAVRMCEPDSGRTILGNLVKAGDLVVLVMPQDIQAPQGRLILPQVQTLRELLDRSCKTLAVTADGFAASLAELRRAPDLIITDSQVFDKIYREKPENTPLTSFSVLFSNYKGDLPVFIKGAARLDELDESSRILIAECCSHAPLQEDIGRVKLPRLLRRRFGSDMKIDIVSGSDYPEDLTQYSLIIHCGGCMFNRKHVMSRVERAIQQNVPISNYGIVIAKLAGILNKISLP